MGRGVHAQGPTQGQGGGEELLAVVVGALDLGKIIEFVFVDQQIWSKINSSAKLVPYVLCYVPK